MRRRYCGFIRPRNSLAFAGVRRLTRRRSAKPSNAQRELIDADLGVGLIKQRVARPGQGRSGGWRTWMAFRSQDRTVFLYGFAKSERANIGPDELVLAQTDERLLDDE